jgi:hypothetical protein
MHEIEEDGDSELIIFCEWARQTLKKKKLQSAPPTD